MTSLFFGGEGQRKGRKGGSAKVTKSDGISLWHRRLEKKKTKFTLAQGRKWQHYFSEKRRKNQDIISAPNNRREHHKLQILPRCRREKKKNELKSL